MQFYIVDSIRFLKELGKNIVLTAWETSDVWISEDGTQFNRAYPLVSGKILNNVMGLCDVVARLVYNEKTEKRGFYLQPTPSVFAKNQIDAQAVLSPGGAFRPGIRRALPEVSFRMILRPYQERYIAKVKEAFMKGYRAPCVVAPCGAGKRVIIGTIVKRTARRGREVLFLVHRKELCDQIEETFAALDVPPDAYNIQMVQTASRGSRQPHGLA